MVVWSGAGISVDEPTGGPIGLALTERALDAYFGAGVPDRVRDIYAEVNPERKLPRLETVLDALTEVYGTDGLRDVLSDLDRAEPNANHAFLAEHLRAGGRHVTANFDRCIERAGSDGAAGERLTHFHGTLGDGDLDKLGARLRVIENGLPATVEQALDEAILGARVLLFVGYSGSDYFDASPYLLSRAPRLHDALVVVWTYGEHEPEPELARFFRAAGADVRRGFGPLRPLFTQLAAAWGFPPLPQPAPRTTPQWTRRLDVTPEQAERASLALYALMGHRGEVLDRFDGPHPPADARDWDRYADALWGAGRYREAAAAWARAFNGDNDDDRAKREERAGAVLWIRGEMLAAERRLRSAMRDWVSSESTVDPAIQARIAETYGRVVTQMRRLPDVRWLARQQRADAAERAIAKLRPRLEGHEGVHLKARLDSVSADLARRADTARDEHVRRFGESEALHAWLNYEHGRLRRLVEQPQPGDQPPTCAELRTLHDRQVAIGAIGDAARVFLLPTAARCYRPREFARELHEIDITRWHRWRLLAGFAARSLIVRIRRAAGS